MSFAATSFAETSFAADTSREEIIGTFPIIYFNGEMLTFVMSLNQVLELDMGINQRFDQNMVINTGINYALFR